MIRRGDPERTPARGAILSVVGPDGAGKSTLIDSLVVGILESHGTLRIRNVGLLPRRTQPQVAVTEPHKDPVYSLFVSLAKLAYVYVDYLLGWFLKVRPFARKGGWVILERGWWDMAVDPARYRMGLPSWLIWSLGRALPHPDLLLILEAPPEVITQRKKELPVEELRRQLESWRERLPISQPRMFLDTSLPAHEVVARAESEVRRLTVATGSSRSSNVVNLPRIGDPRWVLPRRTAPIAAAGLRVYHPVTIKGVVGWELGRVLARMGFLKLLPAGHPPPSVVTKAVEPWVPQGGSVAVARANHPGRYVILILAPDGDIVAAAKTASDAPGLAALEREAANIREFGGHLRTPLVSPRLLEASDGLLVLQAANWTPRARPWHLPEDVASALGAFFRSDRDSSGASGASHGDFAPWNLLRTDDQWMVLDWDRADSRGVAWHDLWHYIVQGHALLKRPRATAIRRGLDGQGWVGAALDAYATAAELPLLGASEALASYLRTSAGELDPGTSDGRRGLDARRALLLTLGG